MAVSFTTGMGRSGALYVDFPENILVEPDLNGRHEHTDIEQLAADIEKHGQMLPVGIRKNDDGKPVLVFGHRRYRAVSFLNERNPSNPRKLICTYTDLNPTEAFIAAIGENRFRREVSPIDDAANIGLLRRLFAKTDEDIAAIYFPEANSEAERAAALKFVKDRAKLMELVPEAAQAVREGRLKITAAMGLAKLTKNQQRANAAVMGTERIKGRDINPAPKAPKPVALTDESLINAVLALVESVDLDDLRNDNALIAVRRRQFLELRTLVMGYKTV
jgi:ParB-like chromosome segregation protein Spo0J